MTDRVDDSPDTSTDTDTAGRTWRADPAVPGRRVVQIGPAAWSVRARTLMVPAVGLAILFLAVAVSVSRGTSTLDLGDVVAALLGAGDRRTTGIVLGLRLPRALVAAGVGAALGLAGAVFQTLARNPLASPDVLGITWGASVGAVSVIVFAGSAGAISGVASSVGVPLAAMIGGVGAGVALYVLAWRRGLDGYRLVLVGIGINAVGYNLVYWLLTIGDVTLAERALTWVVGSVGDADWSSLGPLTLALAVLGPTTLLASRAISGLQLGEDTAKGLGIRVDATRGALLLLGTVLTAIAVSSAGPITFVALAAPQIARRLAGTATPPLVGSLVVGAVLVTVADLIVRTVPLVLGLPVGVLTAILGAPYLIFLFLRSRREARA